MNDEQTSNPEPRTSNLESSPRFFATSDDFRAWLEVNHGKVDVLWVGFFKKGSGRPSITWPESVDEALCFGWIDGLRRSIDQVSYMIRFTPRRPTSNWSAKNVARVEELIAEGRMQPSGLRGYQARLEHKTAVYSFEQREDAELDPGYEKQFKANKKAWKFFQSMPSGYIRTATFWVMSAKRQETRERRLAVLIEDSENERRVKPLRRPGE